MDLGLNGKYALITGGSRGIGRAIALKLAEEGCNVAICARDEKRLAVTESEIRARGVDALALRADLTRPRDINRVIQTVVSRWEAVHILVNNVGGGGRWGSEEIELTDEGVWLDVYNKNVLCAIRCTMKLLPLMMKQKWGRVVAVTSTHGREAGGRPWFNIAKTAETALMKNLATHPRFVRSGITFNSVAPGAIMIPDTGWEAELKKNPRGFKEFVRKNFPLGRLGSPEEVANVVAFLCSEPASLVNGASVLVDGGESRVF